MTPRRLLVGCLAFGMTVAILLFNAQPALAQIPDKKPNIVYMLADNLGYGELGVYGGGISVVPPRRASTRSPAKACACSTSTSKRNARPPGLPS